MENLDELGGVQRAFREGIAGQVDERALDWCLAADLLRFAGLIARRHGHGWQERAHALLRAGTVVEQRL